MTRAKGDKMTLIYAKTHIKDLPALAKAHQYILKGRLSLQGRKRILEERGAEFGLDWLIESFQKLEEEIEKVIEQSYSTHILYPELSRIKGLGGEWGGKLIGFIEAVKDDDGRTGIACFDTMSRFWAFCGYGLPERKQSGKQLNYHPELKAHIRKIAAMGFLIHQNQFSKVYYSRKEIEKGKFDLVVSAKKGEVKKLPEKVTTTLHIHERAVRYMAKVFLGCLYFRWRELLGLPSRPLYSEEHLGHTTRYNLSDFYDK